MKKLLGAALTVFAVSALASCGGGKQEEGFKPSLDPKTECKIVLAGNYDNYEAMEAEFDRFNEYYPNVELTPVKIDDYDNMLPTVLEREKYNIFFSYSRYESDETFAPVVKHMEDLSDPALKFNLDCLRPGIVSRDDESKVHRLPVFCRTYGMLVNNDLFKKEGLEVPSTWSGLTSTCASFVEKKYDSPLMGFTQTSSSSLMNTVAYPMFVAELAKHPGAVELANDLKPEAGQYMRDALNTVKQIFEKGCASMEKCDLIPNNYNDVIMRFFEGDVPMMAATADTVSGMKKRESKSPAYTKNPFSYSFYPIPVTEQGGYLIDSVSLEFSVNKDCDNLDMTNEFMRFLISDQELNNMASKKGLMTPTKTISYGSVYAPFGNVPQERTYTPAALGVKDPLAVQIRNASFKVAKDQLSIDEAIANYGKL